MMIDDEHSYEREYESAWMARSALRRDLEARGIKSKEASEFIGASGPFYSMWMCGEKPRMSPIKVWRLIKLAGWEEAEIDRYQPALFGTVFKNMKVSRMSEELVTAASGLALRKYAIATDPENPEWSLYFRIPLPKEGPHPRFPYEGWSHMTVRPKEHLQQGVIDWLNRKS